VRALRLAALRCVALGFGAICADVMAEHDTAEFLGPEYQWRRVAIRFDDVHSLHGGVRLYLPSWSGHQAFLEVVEPGGEETKYRLRLRLGQKQELCRLLLERDFVSLAQPARDGDPQKVVPDDVRASIVVQNHRGAELTLASWLEQADPRFVAIVRALRAIAEQTEHRRRVRPRFDAPQRVAFILALVTLALLVLGVSFFVSAWVVEVLGLGASHAWLSWVYGASTLAAVAFVHFSERRKSREDRLLRHPWLSAPISLLFALALACAAEASNEDQAQQTIASVLTDGSASECLSLTFGALTAIWLTALFVLVLGPALLDLIDERY
jgi:hypothetical protein